MSISGLLFSFLTNYYFKMEKLLGIMVCRKQGHFKAACRVKGKWAGVWFPLPLCAPCRADCPLPDGSPWRRAGCPSTCPALRDAQCPAGKGSMPARSVSVLGCILACRWELRLGITTTGMTASQEWFSLKTHNFWEWFLFCRWKMWRLFHQMGGSQEERVRICDETENDWHVNVAHSN